jgi:hypothetical protein
MTSKPAKPEPLCMCKDRAVSACPGEWEPGCDLGNNPKHVRVHQQADEERVALDTALGLWVCPWGICNTGQAQKCRAEMRNQKKHRGCGTYFAPGTTLEQAKKIIAPPHPHTPINKE